MLMKLLPRFRRTSPSNLTVRQTQLEGYWRLYLTGAFPMLTPYHRAVLLPRLVVVQEKAMSLTPGLPSTGLLGE